MQRGDIPRLRARDGAGEEEPEKPRPLSGREVQAREVCQDHEKKNCLKKEEIIPVSNIAESLRISKVTSVLATRRPSQDRVEWMGERGKDGDRQGPQTLAFPRKGSRDRAELQLCGWTKGKLFEA